MRGKFPNFCVWGLKKFKDLREVPSSFINLTDLEVPKKVSSFLSYGPKFMLPSFTLHSKEYKNAEWKSLIFELEECGYADVSYKIGQDELLRVYNEHMGDNHPIKEKDLRVFSSAYEINLFLRTNRKDVILVEGDKGKKYGLLYRHKFQNLCNNYITENVESGTYVEFYVEEEMVYLSELKRKYAAIIAPYLLEYSSEDIKVKKIFVQDNQQLGSMRLKGYNAYVRRTLRRVEWKIPILQPTIKFHKDPVKIRPVICKRGTPSISVGKVIKFTIEKLV